MKWLPSCPLTRGQRQPAPTSHHVDITKLLPVLPPGQGCFPDKQLSTGKLAPLSSFCFSIFFFFFKWGNKLLILFFPSIALHSIWIRKNSHTASMSLSNTGCCKSWNTTSNIKVGQLQTYLRHDRSEYSRQFIFQARKASKWVSLVLLVSPLIFYKFQDLLRLSYKCGAL